MAASTPAAPAHSMRLGLIAGVLVLLAVLGVGSFVAYKMLFPAEPKATATTTDSNKSAESPPAQPSAEAAKDGTAPTGTATVGSPDSNLSSQQPPAAAADSSATAPPSPDTAKAAAMQKAAADAKAKAAAAAKADALPTPPAAPAATPPRQAAGPAVAPIPQPDRWELMRQAYEVCSKESLFDRLACNARVGQQYCKGYWGQVPQCPAGAYGDRGNN
jgi:hypothetical protein